jgi:hypothetical protein
MLLNVVPKFVLDALAVPQPGRSLVFAAVVAALFGP